MHGGGGVPEEKVVANSYGESGAGGSTDKGSKQGGEGYGSGRVDP